MEGILIFKIFFIRFINFFKKYVLFASSSFSLSFCKKRLRFLCFVITEKKLKKSKVFLIIFYNFCLIKKKVEKVEIKLRKKLNKIYSIF